MLHFHVNPNLFDNMATCRIVYRCNFQFIFVLSLKSLNTNVFAFASSLYALMLKAEVLFLAKNSSFYEVVSARSFFLLFCLVQRKKLILW